MRKTVKTAAKKVAKKVAKKGAAKKAVSNSRGRSSQFAGMMLRASAAAKKENPHREGSVGFKTFEVIRRAKNGIRFEDAVKAATAAKVEPAFASAHIRFDVASKHIIAS
jgi:hypothetical protein